MYFILKREPLENNRLSVISHSDIAPRPTSPTTVELYQTGLASFTIPVDFLSQLKAWRKASITTEETKKYVSTEGQGACPRLDSSAVRLQYYGYTKHLY